MAKSKVAFTKRVKSIPTYDHFKNSGMSKAGIYNILARFDESGNVDSKPFEGQNYEGWPTWIEKSYQEMIKIVGFFWPI